MNRLRWEWLACTLAVFAFIAVMKSSGVLNRLDAAIYDKLLQLDERPVPEDIVIISIDDLSLQALGTWPWPREHHATMLAQLAKAKPKAVALDLLFLEPSANAKSDEALAQALRLPDLGKVFLPVTARTPLVHGREVEWQMPVPEVAKAVAGFGHINVELDEDGIARSMFVKADGLQGRWPSLPMQMFNASKKEHREATAEIHIIHSASTEPDLLPFSGSPGDFRTVPFISVMRGEVPASVLADKLVLVGVTGTGLGDQYPTPMSSRETLLPGIHIAATALEGLLENRLITRVPAMFALMLNLFLAFAWMLLLFFLGPRRSLLALVFALFLTTGISTVMLMSGRLWWPSATLSTGILLGYLLWSWRRVTVMFLDLKFHANKLIDKDDALEMPLVAVKSEGQNEWQQMLNTLNASLRTAKLHKKRVTDTLEALPEAVLLTDPDGWVETANARARFLLKDDKLESKNALPLLSIQDGSDLIAEANWRSFMNRIQDTQDDGLEVDLALGTTVLLRSTAIKNLSDDLKTNKDDSWWIVMLVDVSKQKQLQRQRNDAMQLLWHDLRAPQSAILTLLRSPEYNSGHLESDQRVALNNRIAEQVHATLGMADDFVWQLRAESDTHERYDVEMVQLINEVIGRAWPLAQAKSIRLAPDFSQLPANLTDEQTEDDFQFLWLHIEPRLMARALFNLIENAIKYSPPQTLVTIALRVKADPSPGVAAGKLIPKYSTAEICITDEGYGISEANLPRIFDRYTRFSTPTSEGDGAVEQVQAGHGLGLRLVKTVVDLHKGTIQCKSRPGEGSVFTIELPIPPHSH